MVSVLPAHLAHEMKTEMIRKIRKAHMKSYLTEDEFQRPKTKRDSGFKKRTSFNSEFSIFKNKTTKISSNSLLEFASRKLSTTLKSPIVSKSRMPCQTDMQLKPQNTPRRNQTGMFVEKARTRSSAFHDLHIKSHSNVR